MCAGCGFVFRDNSRAVRGMSPIDARISSRAVTTGSERAAASLVLILPAASACGGDDGSESEEAESERPKVECSGSPVKPDLPADFPKVDGVTFTKSTAAGPSWVADGYFVGSLEDSYDRYRTAIRGAGYDVIFDEIEEEDSEVTCAGGTSKTSGIVALRENCAQTGRISVHITNRPE
jgi:hypothetical protein